MRLANRTLFQPRVRGLSLLAVSLVPALACSPADTGPSPAFLAARESHAPAEREWRTYLGDAAASHRSPLDQIRPENVARLEVAWRYDSRGASDREDDDGTAAATRTSADSTQIQTNPLIVKGVLYGTSPALHLFALDAATGEELWRFEPEADVRIWTASRGVAWWEERAAGAAGEERLFFGAGPYLHAIDARTGRPIESFGEGGRIDLREGLDRDVGSDPLGVVANTPGTIFEDLILIGGRVNEMKGAAPGDVRAFDVRTGALRWRFRTIPRPGEPGHETWPADAWQRAGGANSWAGITVDPERALAFVPTGSATYDYYGADRAGDNLFANCVVALDARTGERRWHQQLVRHDQWDRDLPAPPNLVTLRRDGAEIPAVAQVTKTGHVFLFHRETGEPLFPLREEPVVGPVIPGEHPAASQPLPTKPPPFVRQGFSREDVTDYSETARAAILERLESMQFGPLYTALGAAQNVVSPGLDGGAEWGGAAWDDTSQLLYVNANQVPWVVQMIEAREGGGIGEQIAAGYLHTCAGCHGLDMRGDGSSVPSLVGIDERLSYFELDRLIRDGRGRMPGLGGMLRWYERAALTWYVYTADADDAPAAWAERSGPKTFVNAGFQKLVDAEGLPGSRPPWGTLTSIDLAAGTIRWQVPLGDYPQVLAAGRRGLGAENYGGPILTAGGLLFIAATPDAKIRAFDPADGDLLWEAPLPAAGFATPATYEARGRQFVVVAAGGGKLGQPSGSEYVAFALPRSEPAPQSR
ncbi:PQQ-binding-like beta-propeller repeat protein [Myxococcota bacterium]|nr:PQQ-binding-like beta-propeller repeat protein [Myxococcota bacterium]